MGQKIWKTKEADFQRDEEAISIMKEIVAQNNKIIDMNIQLLKTFGAPIYIIKNPGGDE